MTENIVTDEETEQYLDQCVNAFCDAARKSYKETLQYHLERYNHSPFTPAEIARKIEGFVDPNYVRQDLNVDSLEEARKVAEYAASEWLYGKERDLRRDGIAEDLKEEILLRSMEQARKELLHEQPGLKIPPVEMSEYDLYYLKQLLKGEYKEGEFIAHLQQLLEHVVRHRQPGQKFWSPLEALASEQLAAARRRQESPDYKAKMEAIRSHCRGMLSLEKGTPEHEAAEAHFQALVAELRALDER
jgi:hypothetical protein